MTTDRTDDGALSPELEAIAAAAPDRLHAQTGQDLSAIDQAARRVAEAASAAIAAGARLSAIADAERDGELRARHELSGDVLRHVTRAAKRKRDTDTRIRAGHRPRRPARTLPPRDRRRRPGLARHRPRDPHPRHHHHRQRAFRRAAVRRTANRASSPHSRRPSPASRRHVGARPGVRRPERAAQLLRTQFPALRQPLGQVIPIRPGAGEVDDAARARRPPSGRRRSAPPPRGRRGRSPAPPTHDDPRTAAPLPAPQASSPGTAIAGSPRERAVIMSGGPSTSTTHVDDSVRGWGISSTPPAPPG